MKLFSLLVSSCLFLINAPEGYARIAFVANVDGNWDLFVTDGNGEHTVRLTRTPFDEREPSWSKDKQMIIYATSNGQLNTLHLKTGENRTIAETTLKTPKITPAFSPDGRQVAFAQFRPPEQGDDTDLMVCALASGKIRRLIDQYAIQIWPAWSPDGERLVYSNMQCSSECGRLIQELWVLNPREKWSRQLLLTHSFCQQPVWSPDGEKIAFSSDQSGNYDIWVVELKSWRLQQITHDPGLDVKPAWSPDKKKIAFISTRSGKMEIWIYDLETRESSKLNPFVDNTFECKDVVW